MKKKDLKFDRPFLIIGTEEQATMYSLGSVSIPTRAEDMVCGGPPRPPAPRQYAWWPIATGKITCYDVEEGVEEYHIEREGYTNVYLYVEKDGKLSKLFENVQSIEERKKRYRLLSVKDGYVLSTPKKEIKLGDKIFDNLYINYDYTLAKDDNIITGYNKSFLSKFKIDGCVLKSLNKNCRITEVTGNDCLINDEYALLRTIDLDFVAFSKDGERLDVPEIKTNLLGLPIVLARKPEGDYTLADFGGVTGIKSISISDKDRDMTFGNNYVRYYRINVVGNETKLFYYIRDPEIKLQSKDEVHIKRQSINADVEVYERFGIWYSFNSLINAETLLGVRESDTTFSYSYRHGASPNSFFQRKMCIHVINEGFLDSHTFHGYEHTKDDDGNEYLITEAEPYVFIISKKSDGKEEDITEKSIHLKVKDKYRIFERMPDKGWYKIKE